MLLLGERFAAFFAVAGPGLLVGGAAVAVHELDEFVAAVEIEAEEVEAVEEGVDGGVGGRFFVVVVAA